MWESLNQAICLKVVATSQTSPTKQGVQLRLRGPTTEGAEAIETSLADRIPNPFYVPWFQPV